MLERREKKLAGLSHDEWLKILPLPSLKTRRESVGLIVTSMILNRLSDLDRDRSSKAGVERTRGRRWERGEETVIMDVKEYLSQNNLQLEFIK